MREKRLRIQSKLKAKISTTAVWIDEGNIYFLSLDRWGIHCVHLYFMGFILPVQMDSLYSFRFKVDGILKCCPNVNSIFVGLGPDLCLLKDDHFINKWHVMVNSWFCHLWWMCLRDDRMTLIFTARCTRLPLGSFTLSLCVTQNSN